MVAMVKDDVIIANLVLCIVSESKQVIRLLSSRFALRLLVIGVGGGTGMTK